MLDKSFVISNKQLLWLFALVPLFWIILVFGTGSFFSFPQTDDFCTFGRLFKLNADNPFLDTWYMYLNWSGRYTSMFIVAFSGWLSRVVPMSENVTYSFMIIFLLSIFLAACLASFHALLTGKWLSTSVAMIAFTVSIVFMPSKLEGIYWLSGSAIYVTGIASFMLLLWSTAKDDQKLTNGFVASYPWASIVLIVVGVGFNELLSLSIGELLFLRMVLSKNQKFSFKQNTLYAVVYLIAFIISISAPGNFLRDKTSVVPRRQVLHALDLTKLSVDHLLQGYISPNIFILSLILLGISVIAYTTKPTKIVGFRYLLPSILTLISALPLQVFIYSFLTGEEAPGRVINQCYAMLLIGSCLLSAWIGMRACYSRHRVGNMCIARIALFIVGVVLVSSVQFRQVVYTIRTFGPIWRQQQIDRVISLQNMDGKSVKLSPFTKESGPTPILQGSDISGDPRYWVNKCMSNMYGTGDVRLFNSASPP